ncbi:MAG: DNA methyltransferase, partial [Anaerolineae bacterium]
DWLAQPPRVLASAGRAPDRFHIIHVTLSDDAPHGRGFPLSITAERVLAHRLLQAQPYALLLFSDTDQRYWHVVNVRDLRQRDRGGGTKLRRVLRRIAIGPDEKLRTAAERIAMLDLAKIAESTIWGQVAPAAIQARHNEAFDVEAVTKQFFIDYVQVFTLLRDHVACFLTSRQDARDFAQQFLNRVMFLYFLQRKGWLGHDANFLARFWKAYQRADTPRDTFVSHWLDVLFFEALNNGFQAGRADRQHLPEDIRGALQMAPYLNGGLFARNELDRGFAQANGTIDDALMAKVFHAFEHYNFTIAEDTPLDQEVAVDPEMLGHVYESLVNVSEEIDERGEAGIFYTPRIEIDLMCRLALVERLANALGHEHRSLLYEAVFAFDQPEKDAADRHLRQHNLWPALDDILQHLTVCDPACGSGSFLVGMLHVLDDLQRRADHELGRLPRPYERKQRIIQRSLYGVDIKRWAIRVAELRLWLQLVVENDTPLEELQFRPLLPSLDFKLRCGDSLVQQVAGVELGHWVGRDISPSLKGRLIQLQGRKRRYFDEAGTEES